MLRWVRELGQGIAILMALAAVSAGSVALGLVIPGLVIPGSAVMAAGGPRASTAYHVTVTPDGQPPVKIHVEEMGSGPVILLIHGLGGSTFYWRHVAPRLATTHRVIAIDLRGFGRSDKPFDQTYGVADHADVVRAFIRQANLSRITLVGHSYGGMIALRLVLDRRLEPWRISRLVAMSAPAYPQNYSPGVRFLNRPLLPYVALLAVPSELIAAVALWGERVGFDQLSERDISIYAEPLAAPGGPHALISTARQIVPPDLDRIIARYPTVAKPTLVLWCREDQVVPLSTGERLARTIPRARLAVIEDCDHMPAEQAPAAVALELRRFLKQ